MTIHQLPPAPPAKSTTHSRTTQAGQRYGGMKHAYDDIPRFSYVLEARNEEPKRDWKDGNLAMLIVTAAACALVCTLADYALTVATSPVGVLLE